MAEKQILKYELSGGIAFLRFNRPEKLNALNRDLVRVLLDRTRRSIDASDVRVLVYTGMGRAFAAGVDISELSEIKDTPEALEWAREEARLWETIARTPKPTIAMVNGLALGGGCELSLACDLRLASTRASFGLPEVKLGLLPAVGGTQRLPRLVGSGLAKEILFTGEPIPAERAREIGLVNRVIEPDELESTTRDWARKLRNRSPLTLRMLKSVVDEGLNSDLQRGLQMERQAFSVLMSSSEAREEIRAFLAEKNS